MDVITILCSVRHSLIPSVIILKNQMEWKPVVTFWTWSKKFERSLNLKIIFKCFAVKTEQYRLNNNIYRDLQNISNWLIEVFMIEISLEISTEQLVDGYCNRELLFILSRCVFTNNSHLRKHLIGWKRKAMIELLITTYLNNISVIVKPIPLPPPVTNATLFLNDMKKCFKKSHTIFYFQFKIMNQIT